MQRFFFFFQNWSVKFKDFCNFLAKNGTISLKSDPVYTRKIPIFFDPTTNDPFFSIRNPTPNGPSFRSPIAHRHFHIRVPPPLRKRK